MTIPDQDDRITAWREERRQEAERQKLERIKQKDQKRLLDQLEAEDAAAKLLADLDTSASYTDEISQQHRQRSSLSQMRFALCMALPTALSLLWFFVLSTPLYQSETSFVVLSPQPDTAVKANSLFVAQDLTDRNHGAFLAENYLQSDDLSQISGGTAFGKSAMMAALAPKLNDYFGASLPDHYLSVDLDYLSGLTHVALLSPDADNAQAQLTQVNQATADKINSLYQSRNDARTEDAEARLRKAETALLAATAKVHEIRLLHGDLDPEAHLRDIYTQIASLTSEMERTRTVLKTLELANGAETQQAQIYRDLIADYEDRISALRNPSEGQNPQSISQSSLDIQQAQFAVSLAKERLNLARARFEAALKSATLSENLMQVVVQPSKAKTPAYPSLPNLLGLSVFLGLIFYSVLQISKRYP